MNFLKNLKNLFEVKANNAVVSQITAKGNYQLSATLIIEEIKRLSKAKIENTRSMLGEEQRAAKFQKEADVAEVDIKTMISAGKKVPKVKAVLVLRKRMLAEALLANAEKLKQTNLAIAEAGVKLGEKLDEVEGQLEIARLDEEFKKEGITMPADVDYSVDSLGVDIEHLTSQVRVFTDSDAKTDVSDFDVEAYMASLTSDKS